MYRQPHYHLELLLFLPLPILCNVCDFSTLPISSVPVGNVTFTTEGTISSTNVRRGVNMSIGTPPQFMAWALGPGNNNSYLFSDKYWETGITLIPEDEYSVGVGGLFIENASSTWTEKSDMSSAGASSESSSTYSSVENDTWGTDILNLNASYHLSDFPIDIMHLGNSIGLGANSTILNALKASGAIASRTWSVFWGLAGYGESAQMNGLTVFGGYDQAKITGKNMTVPLAMDNTCGTNLVVTVSSLDLQFPDGQTVNLESGPIKYCIDPGFFLLSLHPDTLTNFVNHSGGTHVGTSGAIYEENHAQLYLTSGVFDGSLNITFDTGLSIIIPNNQLVVPDYTIQKNGTVTFNDTERAVLVSQGSRDGITLLGQPFLTAAYLMVTHDTDPPALTLWSSNNSPSNNFAAIDSSGNICTSSGFAGTVDQSPTDPDNNNSSTAATPSTSASATTSPDKSSTSSKSNGISGGAIAGIVLGSLCFLLIISGGIFFFNKRRRGFSSEAVGSHSSVATELQPRWPAPEAQEVSDVSQLKAELPGTPELLPQQLQPAETPTAELPGNKREMSGELQSQSYQRTSSSDMRYELD